MNWEPERLDDQKQLTRATRRACCARWPPRRRRSAPPTGPRVEADLSALRRRAGPGRSWSRAWAARRIAGDILAAVCGHGAPLPIVTVRSYRLPGWVGATDLVIAVSCSGRTEETLAAAIEAVRRGCACSSLGRRDSPLEAIARQAGAPFVPVTTRRAAPRRRLGADDPAGRRRRRAGPGRGRRGGVRARGQALEDIAAPLPPVERVVHQPGQVAGHGAGRDACR